MSKAEKIIMLIIFTVPSCFILSEIMSPLFSNSLSESNAAWGEFLVISTLVVLAAIIVEFVCEFTPYIADEDLNKSVMRFATIVLAIGVAGELLGEGETISKGDIIQGQLNLEARRLSAEAEAAKKEIATTKKSASDANLEAARIEQTVAWRTIKPFDFFILLNSLKGLKHTVTIAYTENDPEALSYAIPIENAFAGSLSAWTVTALPRIYSDRVIYGVHVPGPENDAVIAIRNAFRKASIPFDTEPVPQPVTVLGSMSTIESPITTEALVMIGSKPRPSQ